MFVVKTILEAFFIFGSFFKGSPKRIPFLTAAPWICVGRLRKEFFFPSPFVSLLFELIQPKF
jgi:hypothetical protein